MRKLRVLRVTSLLGTILLASPTGATPIPPIVERMLKEGITIRPTETKVQAALGNSGDGVHLVKLLKDQTYGIELASSEFNGRLSIEKAAGGMAPVISKDGKLTFKAPSDGTYRLAVSAVGAGSGKYAVVMQQFAASKLRPGVHSVGPGGLTLQDALDQNDQADRVRKHKCKVFEVQFEAGKNYTIDLNSQWDNYLRLEDENLQQLAEDDDSGGFPNARIQFRAPADGTYRVIATSFGGAVGPFTLKIRGN